MLLASEKQSGFFWPEHQRQRIKVFIGLTPEYMRAVIVGRQVVKLKLDPQGDVVGNRHFRRLQRRASLRGDSVVRSANELAII
jgi:hypothetical protein